MTECFRMYTKVIMGRNSVMLNGGLFRDSGRKAAVVMGRRSGHISGAFEDVAAVLKSMGIGYIPIDIIKNNPDLENVKQAADIAKNEGADYIIGIGGGSPLDAAKAAAVLCTNDIDPGGLFGCPADHDPLPVIAVPTTAGTGSEVTPYSVLTVRERGTKVSFSDDRVFPRYALLDCRYTDTLNRDITVDTAVDAFTHAFEGYISKRSTRVSDMIAIESMKIFFDNHERLSYFEMDEKSREDLLYASMLSGMVISQTGTTALHGMGYSLTYNMDIPHGKANGLLFPEYAKELYDEDRENMDGLVKQLGFNKLSDMIEKFHELYPDGITYGSGDTDRYASDTMKQKALAYTPLDLDKDRIKKIFESVGK